MRKSMKTKRKDIAEYWAKEQSGYFADANETTCMICEATERSEFTRFVERCHIVPDSLGGEDAPHNYMLLCFECHAEAPNTVDREYFIDYTLKAKERRANSLMATFNYLMQKFKEAGVLPRDMDFPLFKKCLRKADPPTEKLTSTHWGQGAPNLSTRRWVMDRVVALYLEEINLRTLAESS